jgi:glutaredoxin
MVATTLTELMVKITGDPSGLTAAVATAKGEVSGLQSSLGNLSNIGLATVTVPIVAIGAAAIKSGLDVQSAYSQIQNVTGATGTKLDELKQRFDTVAANVPESFSQVATAIGEVNDRLTQIKGNADAFATSFTTQMLNLSRITGTDVKSDIDSLTSSFIAWGVTADQMSGKADELYTLFTDTGVSVTDLATLLAKAAGPAKDAGLSFEQTALMMGEMTIAGIPARQAVAMINTETINAAKNGKDAATEWNNFMERLKDPSYKVTASDIKEFGTQVEKFANASQETRDKWAGLMNDMANSPGKINSTADATKTFGQKLDEFKNKAELAFAPLGTTLITILSNFLDAMTPVIKIVSDAVTWFSKLPKPVQDVGIAVGILAAGIPILTTAWTVMSGAITTVLGGLTTLTTALGITGGADTTLAGESATASGALVTEGAAGDTAAGGIGAAGDAAVIAEGSMVALAGELAILAAAFLYLKYTSDQAAASVKQTKADAAAAVVPSGTSIVPSTGQPVSTGLGSPNLDTSKLKYMQHGGIVTNEMLAVLADAGPEAVIPLSGLSGGPNYLKLMNDQLDSLNSQIQDSVNISLQQYGISTDQYSTLITANDQRDITNTTLATHTTPIADTAVSTAATATSTEAAKACGCGSSSGASGSAGAGSGASACSGGSCPAAASNNNTAAVNDNTAAQTQATDATQALIGYQLSTTPLSTTSVPASLGVTQAALIGVGSMYSTPMTASGPTGASTGGNATEAGWGVTQPGGGNSTAVTGNSTSPVNANGSLVMPAVTVLRQAGCEYCDQIEQQLTAAGIPYTTLDINTSAAGAADAKKFGLTSTPGVILPSGQYLADTSGVGDMVSAIKSVQAGYKAQATIPPDFGPGNTTLANATAANVTGNATIKSYPAQPSWYTGKCWICETDASRAAILAAGPNNAADTTTTLGGGLSVLGGVGSDVMGAIKSGIDSFLNPTSPASGKSGNTALIAAPMEIGTAVGSAIGNVDWGTIGNTLGTSIMSAPSVVSGGVDWLTNALGLTQPEMNARGAGTSQVPTPGGLLDPNGPYAAITTPLNTIAQVLSPSMGPLAQLILGSPNWTGAGARDSTGTPTGMLGIETPITSNPIYKAITEPIENLLNAAPSKSPGAGNINVETFPTAGPAFENALFPGLPALTQTVGAATNLLDNISPTSIAQGFVNAIDPTHFVASTVLGSILNPSRGYITGTDSGQLGTGAAEATSAQRPASYGPEGYQNVGSQSVVGPLGLGADVYGKTIAQVLGLGGQKAQDTQMWEGMTQGIGKPGNSPLSMIVDPIVGLIDWATGGTATKAGAIGTMSAHGGNEMARGESTPVDWGKTDQLVGMKTSADNINKEIGAMQSDYKAGNTGLAGVYKEAVSQVAYAGKLNTQFKAQDALTVLGNNYLTSMGLHLDQFGNILNQNNKLIESADATVNAGLIAQTAEFKNLQSQEATLAAQVWSAQTGAGLNADQAGYVGSMGSDLSGATGNFGSWLDSSGYGAQLPASTNPQAEGQAGINAAKGLLGQEGGIATKATMRIFGEAGAEALLPLTKLQPMINDAVSSAIQSVTQSQQVNSTASSKGRHVVYNINVSGIKSDEIVKTIMKKLKMQSLLEYGGGAPPW